MTDHSRYPNSAALFARAQEIIPGGIHLSGRPLLRPDCSPMYFERGKGSCIWDADQNEYIDFINAYGPFLLGYADEEVDAAAFRQSASGNLLSLNHPLHLAFVEALLRRFPNADMGVFVKTGSEATTAAVRIARRATGRRLVARCGYHGWHDWCVPDEDFVPEGLRDQIVAYDASRPETLVAALASRPGQFAAVILAPETIYPMDREKLACLMQTARSHGAIFIMDEVKTGIRAPGHSMQALYDIRPDLTTLSKALGNGWPIGAVLGRREVIRHAAGMHLSATYHGETAAMAAAIATLAIVDRDRVQEHVWTLGERLISGLNEAAQQAGFPGRAYAEPMPSMPFLAVLHPEPATCDRLRHFLYEEVLARGVLLHPRHLWFISRSHTVEQIDRTIEVTAQAMRTALGRLGSKQA